MPLCTVFTLCLSPPAVGSAQELSQSSQFAADKLLAAYPDFLERREGDMLVWRDGTKMLIDDGIVDKPPAQVLASPDLKDQFATPYNVGPQSAAPGEAVDPGRVRVDAFFRKIYGDCRKGGVAGSLVAVPWLPRHGGGTVRATSINGVAARLKEVSDELDSLPDQFISYLVPTAGVFSCRVIAGTERTSMHAYGAAIDLNATHANYWRTANTDGAGHLVYQNAIPNEIVDIFERHGFIWGGKWYHYDTMHFEFRPELLPPLPPLGTTTP